MPGISTCSGEPALQLGISEYQRAVDHHVVLQNELTSFFLGPFIDLFGAHVPLLGVGYLGRPEPAYPPSHTFPTTALAFDPTPLRQSIAVENMLARRVSAELDAAKFALRLVDATEKLIALLEGDD